MEYENNNKNVIDLYLKRRNFLYSKQYYFIERKKFLNKHEKKEMKKKIFGIDEDITILKKAIDNKWFDN